MRKPHDIKLLIFYLWVALAFLCLWIFHDLSNFPLSFFQSLLNNAWRVIYVSFLNFLFFEYTVPFVIRKRKYILYNVILVAPVLFICMILWSFGLAGWRRLGIELAIYTPFIAKGSPSMPEVQMEFSMSSVFFFGIIRHIYNYVKLKQSAQQLRIEKQEAELNFLRSQTNPHFLFNTLNNIYSLARDKSSLAPESILRLSKILRYMLYETGGNFIAVEQELKIITDYIELEKLRYDESLKINFNYDIEDMKQALPPLLLIPLVENAFKHGVSETRSNPFVDIHLSINNRQLKFVVKNSAEESFEQKTVRENIGLFNLRRQLQLLYTDYDLSAQQTNTVFIAILKINLASHV
jgi:two-component system, LytTR family, sensor kinase